MDNSVQTYYSSLGQVLLFILGGILFVSIALLVSKMLRPSRPNVEKLSSYESGEQPQGSGWVQFNLRFYIIALVFLLFEVEVIFLFPWATVFANKELMDETAGAWGEYALVEMLIFIGLLALGLAYAWINGHLSWIKPEPQTTQFKSPVPKALYDQLNQRYK